MLTYFFKEKPLIQSETNSKIISIQLNQIKKQEVKKTIVKEKTKPKVKKKTKVKPKPKPKKIQKIVSKKLAVKKKAKKKLLIKEEVKKVKSEKIVEQLSKKEVKENIVRKELEDEQRKLKESQLLIKKQSQKSKANYYSKLKQYIATYKSYPSISRRLGEEGISEVSFRVLKNGTFTNIKLRHSSGADRLDEAALESIEEANKFDAFDKKIKDKYLDFKVQLEYKLE